MTSRVRRSVIIVAASALVLAAAGGWWAQRGRSIEPSLPTGAVTRGAFSDIVEIRGEVRPVRSTLVMAPANAGELVILKIARNGTAVNPTDVVAEFDAVTMRQAIQQKESELRGATAEMEQAKGQTKITLEEKNAAVRRARFDVVKAQLSVTDVSLVGSIENEKSKLALADAEQRLREVEAAEDAAKVSAEADFAGRNRRMDLIKAELAKAQNAVKSLLATAPIAGTVNILPNYRSAGPMGGAAEYRPGDKTYAGAPILELPDLSEVFLVARLDETDRGLLRPGQTASIRADAVADRDYEAKISDISLLARVDFSGGWPPTKQFDLKITFTTPDGRLRPGMSAVARIAVGEIADVLMVPTKAIFAEGGRPVIYRYRGRDFSAVPIEIIRRGKELAAIKADVRPGDRVALLSPVADGKAGS